MNCISFSALLVNLGILMVAVGLKLDNASVPQYAVLYGQASLFCDFQLETDLLLSLKWYKDDRNEFHEFFRYSPQIRPPILVFPVEGVYVNITQSGLNHVLLKNISLSSSGTYKCEVSADRPSFRTLSQQGNMIVIAPPANDPEITENPAVSVGDTFRANCTSFHSQPAASLMFYVNEEKAEAGEMIEYLPVSESNGLETSILGIHFPLEPRHFRGGSMELKCTATIGNSYRVKKISVTEANINAQPSIPGHNRLQLSGVNSFKSGSFKVLILSSISLVKVVQILSQF